MLQTRIAILPQSPSCFPLSRNTEEMEDKSKKKKDDRTNERKRDFKMAGGERAEWKMKEK